MESKIADMYDLVIIGSSPIALLEALSRSDNGQRVAVVDKSERIGGAWSLVDVFGWKGVEISAHIMRDWEGGYRYLQSYLDLKLEAVVPQPAIAVIRNNKLRVKYQYNKRWIIEAVNFLDDLGKLDQLSAMFKSPRASLINPILSILHYNLRDLKNGFPRVKYPVGGSRELVNILEKQCREKSVDLLSGVTAESFSVGTGGGYASIRCNDRALETRKIGFTRNSVLNEVFIDGDRLDIEADPLETTHLYLWFTDFKGPGKFSFLNLKNDDYFHMISDVTRYSDKPSDVPGDSRLVVAWLNADSVQNREDANRHFQHLCGLGLLPARAKLHDWEKRHFALNNLTDASIKKLTSLEGCPFEYLETGDLTRDIEFHEPRWLTAEK
jgi:hypothetical protein